MRTDKRVEVVGEAGQALGLGEPARLAADEPGGGVVGVGVLVDLRPKRHRRNLMLVPFGPSMVDVVTVFAAFTSAVPLTTGWVLVDAALGAMVPSAPVAAAAV